ncbi:MAG: gamma-glutamyl-gamma-aminobutyrate hydrolase family protein [Flavobacteriales bacterium]|nr:gamma-glutamyl-gamma-aminobutyrate hydrolase family protein [Flavobacteriales bacterium]
MRILIVDCGSSKVPDIVAILRKLNVECTSIKWNELKGDELHYNGVIISGAPVLLTNTSADPYIEKIKPLIKISVPVLGICFGHQILGIINGAYIAKCSEDRAWQEITIIHPYGLFAGFNNWVMMREDHTECIDLPHGFRRDAGSEICANEAMHHEKYPWYGVQFHPESSGEMGEKLFNNFLTICKSWS